MHSSPVLQGIDTLEFVYLFIETFQYLKYGTFLLKDNPK